MSFENGFKSINVVSQYFLKNMLIIFRTLAAQFKYALVWGTSTKYSPQRVGLSHIMADEDVIQVVKK